MHDDGHISSSCERFIATAADNGTIDYRNLYHCTNRSAPADVLINTVNLKIKRKILLNRTAIIKVLKTYQMFVRVTMCRFGVLIVRLLGSGVQISRSTASIK